MEEKVSLVPVIFVTACRSLFCPALYGSPECLTCCTPSPDTSRADDILSAFFEI